MNVDSNVLSTTKLNEQGLNDLRAHLGNPQVSDEELQRLVISVQARIVSQKRLENLAVQLHENRENNKFYRKVLSRFSPFYYYRFGMRKIDPEDSILHALNLFGIVSEGSPYEISGKIVVDGDSIYITSLDDFTQEGAVANNLTLSLEYKDDRFQGSLRTTPYLNSNFLGIYNWVLSWFSNPELLELSLNPRKHLEYTSEHLKDLQRIKRNLKRYKL